MKGSRLAIYGHSEELYWKWKRLSHFGANFPYDTLSSVHILALILHELVELTEAEELCQEALSGMQRVLSDYEAKTHEIRNNLANILADQGQFSEAEELHTAVLESNSAFLPEMLK